MMDRAAQIEAFLKDAGWQDAARSAVADDASTRSYIRLQRGEMRALLMIAPKGSEAPGEPDGATVEQRRAIGYNALARLAGPNLEAFVAIAQELSRRGFSAPTVLATDLDAGFALLEDFGTGDFFQVIAADPSQERPLYEAAVDVLAAIYRSTFPAVSTVQGASWRKGASWRIREYDAAAQLAETNLFLDYFAPDVGRPIGDGARAEFYALWEEAFKTFDAHAAGLALRDFHAQNLFWLPKRDGTDRVGLIDFQDALFAHPSYDLASLLEDIRRDVDEALFEPLKERFCRTAGIPYDQAFQAAYHVQAAQRATKLLGFPVRADKDFGKPQYRALLPRVQHHLKRDLSHPACASLRLWFETHCPEVFG
jgi:aminoglycoside/choline kinase family phosphotransferase